MPVFNHIATLPAPDQVNSEGNVVDLVMVETQSGDWLYSATRDGGISVWNFSANGPASLVQHLAAPNDAARQNLIDLDIFEGADGPYLVTGGVFGHALAMFDINEQTGHIAAQPSMLEPSLGGFLSATAQVGGADYIYTTERGAVEVQGHAVGADLSLSSRGSLTQDNTVTALTTATVGSSDFLLVATNTVQTLTSYRIQSDGSTTDETGIVSAFSGPGFRTPTALAVAEVDGTTYVILAAAGSSSLSVMALDSTGALTTTDHVLDGLGTRFQGVTALEVITRDNNVFVLAGGADDGISLLTLLPGGRLQHLAHVADTPFTTLKNVATLTGLATNDGLSVFAGSAGEAGITQFEIDLADYGGATRSAIGQTTLTGSAVDDILIAGDGIVHLIGGAGADTFIFDPATATEDGDLGHIDDFNPNEDMVDLSSVLSLYGLDDVQIQGGGSQAILSLGPYTLEITAATNTTLTQADFAIEKIKLTDRPALDPWNHPAVLDAEPDPDPEPEPELGLTLTGTATRDVLYGSNYDDFIYGMAGNDELHGGAGNDMMAGGAGTDFIVGNSGNDVLTGSGLSDLLYGGPGDDFVNGGWGYDRINGGTGADRFFHIGIFDHGSDWVQDYSADEGDVLFFGIGTATANNFKVNFVETANAGQAGVEEAFVIYSPTGQIMWALIDGAAQDALYLQIGGYAEVFDLLG
jgi:Ca2+-binding RTX toxin-like protein